MERRTTSLTGNVFALPTALAAKGDPALIAEDERHLAAVADCLAQTISHLAAALAAERATPGSIGQAAMDRDLQVHRLSARLRALRRFGLDLCLGRMVAQPVRADSTAAPKPVYIGRLGLTDDAGAQLLVDWRSPAAAPFFGATHADPMGLASRRRYRWVAGRVSDYWDEVFTPEGLIGHAALDDQSAFIASLGGHRSARMRDVLGTLQADQDAVVRAGSRGALVVDGGPGTGKTVAALHRAAYLVYSEPRLSGRQGGVLVVGPHQPYLAYVADVLPSLGEDSVQTCTLQDLVSEGATAVPETDPRVRALKSSAGVVDAVTAAVRFHETPPDRGMTVTAPASDVWLSPDDWTEAFAAPDPGIPHNEAREQVWEALLGIVRDKQDSDVSPDELDAHLQQDGELVRTLHRAWPLIDATDLVADLWAVPAYLRRCAPWLDADEIRALTRGYGEPWTVADLPWLDAARHRLGDPAAVRSARRREAAVRAQREQMTRVVDDLVEADADEYGVGLVGMLRGEDFVDAVIDTSGLPAARHGGLTGPFGHIVVDEAQELTDAQWQMLLVRCPSQSFTVVGDRAQARRGFPESWTQRLARVGLDRVTVSALRINYRTPREVMDEAEPVIRAVLPDANVPTSVRSSGIPVTHGRVAELGPLLGEWLAATSEGVACVISVGGDHPGLPTTPRVHALTPELAKGLEFDLVVLIDPERFGGDGDTADVTGAVDRYVAMTRATQRLVVLRGTAG